MFVIFIEIDFIFLIVFLCNLILFLELSKKLQEYCWVKEINVAKPIIEIM